MYRIVLKSIIDRLLGAIILLVTFPILFTFGFLLMIANKGKVFFIQPRTGINEKVFFIYKFKTMNDQKDINGRLLPDSERLTSIGTFIRKYSIDELPQLFNVLIGDMSLVGPRPLLTKYLPLYSDNQRKRHSLKPGITGWAQINGRNSISWEKKFELDVWYTENVCLSLDLRILLSTIVRIIVRKDINKEGYATEEEFTGK